MTGIILRVSAVYLCIFFSLASAEETSRLKLNFWSRLTMGQVVSSTREPGYDIPFEKEWLETVDGGIKVSYKLTPSLTGRLNLGAVVNVATVSPKETRTFEYSAKKVTPALLDACLEYQVGGLFSDNDLFNIELGYFPFKYNQQSTNLGEYLFRTGTYPGWIISGFEHSIDKPKLAGVHVSYTLGSLFRLRQDLIMNTEVDIFPFHDIHLSYIASPSIGKFLDASAGIQFARLITVDHRKTTLGTDPVYKGKFEPLLGYIDTTKKDTILYTFKGIKLMGRANWDIKETFGGFGSDFFGKEDLKVYGELAILGLKDYPGWYNERKDRIPKMLGFNWPTHQLTSYCVVPGLMAYGLETVKDKKLKKAIGFGTGGIIFGVGTWLMDRLLKTNSKLDILSIEFEHNPSPYVNTQDYIWKASSAVPYIPGQVIYLNYDKDWKDSMAVTDDDYRWSIYASKRFGKYVRLSAQAACDHTPKSWYTPWPAPQSAKYSDVVPKNDDWYFMMRMSINF